MDIRSIRFALTVAEELHFGRSAAQHHIAAQPFGLAVKRLEIDIGFRIFERTSRRVTVTARGAQFLADARLAVAAFENLVDDPARNATSGDERVRVGVLGIGLAGFWPEFHASLLDALPALSTAFEDLLLTEQYSAVRERRIDFGIVQYIAPVDGLDFIPLLATPRAAVVPRHSDFAEADRLLPQDLAGSPWVDVGPTGTPLCDWLGAAWADGRSGDRILSPAAIPAAVAATGRLGVHALAAADYYGRPDVRFVPLEGPPCRIAIALRQGDDRPIVRAVRAAADLMLNTHETSSALINC